MKKLMIEKIDTYLKGAKGEAPIRMLIFARYNFIRADFRRTEYPAAMFHLLIYVPRLLYYPLSEVDGNTSAKQQLGMDSRIFCNVQ